MPTHKPTNEYLKKRAGDWYDRLVRDYKEAAEQMARNKKRFEESFDGFTNGTNKPSAATPIDILSGTISDINSLNYNLRLDKAVTLAADIGSSEISS